MSELGGLLTAIVISFALSSATVFAIHAPLQRLLEAVCPAGSTAVFWARAAVTVIYLMPLWVVLVFGLPDFERSGSVSGGEVARRALAAASFALVAIVLAMGLRLSALQPEAHRESAVR
jgi:hypothetical protein